eukprot:TRINITY_DN6613_c0_g1_i1.p1 TRINITY_DN6613_c0_g1~~TRINITY_DN6613_c0_g1_i1.p1  ORF type:complete len:486 (+),score=68.52 TRINITY_DN6613_c0_g1_i1:97-1554(+)
MSSDNNLDTEDIIYVDQLISDFFLYRGYLYSRRAFIRDTEDDKNKGFQVTKIVSNLFHFVETHDLAGLLDMWNHLMESFFSKLSESFTWSISKLELSLKRYYIVHTIKANRRDKCLEFFQVFGHEISNDRQWRNWFVLPYATDPATLPTFKVYFTESWKQMLYMSIHNILTAIFVDMNLPKILQFKSERNTRIAQKQVLDQCKAENQRLRDRIEDLRIELEQQQRIASELESTFTAHGGLTTSVNFPSSYFPNINSDNDLEIQETQNDVNTENLMDDHLDESTNDSDSKRYSSQIGESPVQSRRSESISTTVTSTPSSAPVTNNTNTKTNTSSTGTYVGGSNDKVLFQTKQQVFTEVSPVNSIRFSPNGSMFAAGLENGSVKIFPTESINPSPDVIQGSSPITSLDWEPKSGKSLLCGNMDGKVRIYSISPEDKKIQGEVLMSPSFKRVLFVRCGPFNKGNIFGGNSCCCFCYCCCYHYCCCCYY